MTFILLKAFYQQWNKVNVANFETGFLDKELKKYASTPVSKNKNINCYCSLTSNSSFCFPRKLPDNRAKPFPNISPPTIPATQYFTTSLVNPSPLSNTFGLSELLKVIDSVFKKRYIIDVNIAGKRSLSILDFETSIRYCTAL